MLGCIHLVLFSTRQLASFDEISALESWWPLNSAFDFQGRRVVVYRLATSRDSIRTLSETSESRCFSATRAVTATTRLFKSHCTAAGAYNSQRRSLPTPPVAP